MAGPSLAEDQGESPIRELARRFFITFLLGVVIYRLGVFIPIPGVDVAVLKAKVAGAAAEGGPLSAIIAFADMFNGGAIMNASLFGLGIMPYISASIIIQLLTFSMPQLKAIQKEGEGGRRKINQYTRYATLAICSIQAVMAASALSGIQHDGKVLVTIESKAFFIAQASLVIVTGSMMLLWISEQITKFGIGNGVSVVIMISILAGLPAAFSGGEGAGLPHYLLIGLVSLSIIAGIVVVVQAVRRIGLEQQRRVQGNKVYGGQQTSLPLKLNQANVIPVIFAQPVMMAIGMILGYIGTYLGLEQLGQLFSWGTPLYRYLFAALIIGFTFFYISITFDLFDLANHFKQSGFFIRGIKPGKNTVDYLAFHLKRITFMGAVFLALVAILPEMLESNMGLSGRSGAMLMGGTGLLIIVGVSLDIMQKVGAFFLAHQYRGLGGIGDENAPKKGGKRF
jgi:preprotein translocase subunit SecY